MPPTGPERNARLTALTGTVLLVLLAVEGVTLISLRSMLSWHIFVGVLVIPVVLLKLASTGYKFFRYYTGRPDYVRAGPPQILLRLLGPLVIVSTVVLLASGVALIWIGPRGGFTLLLHKASFVIWLGALGIHVLAHLRRVPESIGADVVAPDGVGGSRLRLLLIATAIVLGAVAAVVVEPHGAAWIHSFGHGHGRGGDG